MKIFLFSPPFAECADCFASRTEASPFAGFRLAAEVSSPRLRSVLPAVRRRYAIRIGKDGRISASARDFLTAFRAVMDAPDFEAAEYEVVTHLSGGRATALSRKGCVDAYAEERRIVGRYISVIDRGTKFKPHSALSTTDRRPPKGENAFAVFKCTDCEGVADAIRKSFDEMPQHVIAENEYSIPPRNIAAWVRSRLEIERERRGVEWVEVI